MPGSPPTSTADAGTSPPPSTRSNSAMPVAQRGGGSALPASPTNATRLPVAPFAAGPGRAAIASSTMLFHSPHASQRPAHFGATAPQLWQTNRDVGLANAALVAVRRQHHLATGRILHRADQQQPPPVALRCHILAVLQRLLLGV